MKCVSFNVNSVRQRLHQLQAVVDRYQPEFVGLQETKVEDQDFPRAELEQMGFHVEYTGQKTHYGVALLSRLPFKRCVKSYETDPPEAQKRFIAGEFELTNGRTITVMNGYFPQGENRDHPVKFPNKRRYYADLLAHLNANHKPQDWLVIMGDMNVSPEDIDIGIGEDNRKRWLKTGKCSFLPEERLWLKALFDWGLQDTYRRHFPDDATTFSWFDYRSRGFERDPKRGLRIDLILASHALAERSKSAGVDYQIRGMTKPSDHCPVWTEFDVEK